MVEKSICALTNLLIAVALFASDVTSVVETERRFSKLAAEKGIREAFLFYLADDSVVFHPGPVNGKKWYAGRPPVPGLLSWEPVVALVSSAGDLSFTTGPWEFRSKKEADKPIATGTFFTIWRKQASGDWKAILDLGVDHPPAPVPAAAFKQLSKPLRPGGSRDVPEQDFSQKRYEELLAEDAWLLRSGHAPVSGRSEILKYLTSEPETTNWNPIKSEVARSGDLAYVYGSAEMQNKTANYVRIWKVEEDGKWRIALDILASR